ncbi:MAG TPA: hypothetical protein VJQ47_10065, partial [Steroidobacteraceae bacterium]|nr:hypothetical protein [Steroidobacteraceae bacterium]
VNVGWGEDLTIRELAEALARVIGFEGAFQFDPTKPDGTPRKVLDTSRLRSLGWAPRVPLETGLGLTYNWYRQNVTRDLPLTSAA